MIRLGPYVKSYSSLPAASAATSDKTAKVWAVVESMPAIPGTAGLFGGALERTFEEVYEYSNVEDGVESLVRSSMGVSIRTVWKVVAEQRKEGQQLTVVVEGEITCPRLLSGVIVKQEGKNWSSVSEKLVEAVRKVEDTGAGAVMDSHGGVEAVDL